MKISYKKLWVLLIQRDISKVTLRKEVGIAAGTMSKLNKGEEVALPILLRICDYLDCDIGDICEAVREENSPAIKEASDRDGTKRIQCGRGEAIIWFIEFRKVVELLSEGKDINQIKSLALNENLFAAPTTLRANQIYHTVTGRIKTLDKSFIPLFMRSDLATQKLFALVAAMAYDTLFFDFVYEVIREKMILGTTELSDSDVRVFFKDKQQQNEKVAGWTDATLVRLGRCYKTMLYEAGVIDKAKTARKILRPILDPELVRWLNQNDMGVYVKALAGVR